MYFKIFHARFFDYVDVQQQWLLITWQLHSQFPYKYYLHHLHHQHISVFFSLKSDTNWKLNLKHSNSYPILLTTKQWLYSKPHTKTNNRQ